MSIKNITMPQLGESVTEGTISRWLVQSGDHVNKYDPLAEVMTDKVNAEIPSSFTGTIDQLLVEEGTTLAVGETICTIQTDEADEDATNEKTVENKEANVDHSTITAINGQQSIGKTRYSPAVLSMSQEHGIDLSLVKGTGKEGRITRKDLQRLIDANEIPKVEESAVPIAPAKKPEPVHTMAGDIEIPVSGVRRAIATKMLRSKSEIPHAWMMMEVDVTNLVKYRDELKTEFKEREGFSLTYFAFFVKAVAQALKEFPMINSMWAGDKIIQKKDINISIAVAKEEELFVPVIKHADEKSIKGIARDITDLAKKVRNGTLKSEEMQGGTFTINNTGSFGSVQSIGIINYPQAAILQVESIIKRPVVVNDGIAIRDMVNLCLSLDHRVLDGLICGRFLQRVKEILENIPKENTSVY
ncbi:2-oxo acid dehydrogenase subunit E2 [Bacillus sp. FJAT-49732]|uniref:Dihydrolipoamide acetyltransferase component of pyruvate dehydrogenase complex n=1 Tax=Lederbergia citrisecunda TaxID=2833583 RepID=A0A942TPK5_9BACI|nr:dihydrolipoamide acetyltransferase family protein [Lederbergia citrisecunda]MBS4199604.1 2-oxo acid dehydrogenase subunit E2 [Lederbergia citrisecunda]